MYFSDEFIEEVRSRNDIVDVVGERVHLERKGSNHFGLCPFHNEKSPSFSVQQSKQIFHCFGCGEGGNVFTFLMKYENMTFPEAVKELAKRAGMELPEDDRSCGTRNRRCTPSTRKRRYIITKNSTMGVRPGAFSISRKEASMMPS